MAMERHFSFFGIDADFLGIDLGAALKSRVYLLFHVAFAGVFLAER